MLSHRGNNEKSGFDARFFCSTGTVGRLSDDWDRLTRSRERKSHGGHPVQLAACPIKAGQWSAAPAAAAPRLGADTRAVLESLLGLGALECADLAARNVVEFAE